MSAADMVPNRLGVPHRHVPKAFPGRAVSAADSVPDSYRVSTSCALPTSSGVRASFKGASSHVPATVHDGDADDHDNSRGKND